MNRLLADRRARLNLLGAAILLVGLAGAALVYHRAEKAAAGLGYEELGGQLYRILPEDSKQYQRGLELYGGTANVLADELRRWLVSWFEGKSLAYLIAVVTVLISLGFFYAANYSTERNKAVSPGDDSG